MSRKATNIVLAIVMIPIAVVAVLLGFGFFGAVCTAIWFVFIWLLTHWETWVVFGILLIAGVIHDKRRPKVRDTSGRWS